MPGDTPYYHLPNAIFDMDDVPATVSRSVDEDIKAIHDLADDFPCLKPYPPTAGDPSTPPKSRKKIPPGFRPKFTFKKRPSTDNTDVVSTSIQRASSVSLVGIAIRSRMLRAQILNAADNKKRKASSPVATLDGRRYAIEDEPFFHLVEQNQNMKMSRPVRRNGPPGMPVCPPSPNTQETWTDIFGCQHVIPKRKTVSRHSLPAMFKKVKPSAL